MQAATPYVLVIAGSDPSGGAGLQGDIATLHHLGVCPLAVPSALTVQGRRGVRRVFGLPPEQTFAAICALLDDYPVAAVKIGMLHNVATLRAVARALRDYRGPVVLDPILRPTRGRSLATDALPKAMLDSLWPLLRLVTPNLPEAEQLCGMPLDSVEMRIAAAQALQALGCAAVLLKGGHAEDSAAAGGSDFALQRSLDILSTPQRLFFLAGPRRETTRTHGTGCALSSAIAAGFSLGYNAKSACLFGRQALDAALRDGHSLGHGSGAVAHAAMGQASRDVQCWRA